jgi:hypothetical protein
MSSAMLGRDAMRDIAEALGLSTKGLREIRIKYTLYDAVMVECDYIAKPDSEDQMIKTIAAACNGIGANSSEQIDHG